MKGGDEHTPVTREGFEPVMDDAGKFTGYYREIATGEIFTLDDEWDEADDHDD